ncbi:Polyamine transporter 1 [Spathaspora sp. JA1]|nr:Polyamine transporter 1 [Spathaspora sp. JA1]
MSSSDTDTSSLPDVNQTKPYQPSLTESFHEGLQENEDELSRYESNINLSRTLSRKLTGAEELILEAQKLSDEPLPSMGADRPYPPMLPDRGPYAVGFDGPLDPLHPHNYPVMKKILFCASVGMAALSVSMGSAMFAESSQDLMEIYGIGISVAALTTSLFVFGFASGPVIYGPLSELYGRKIIMVISCLGYVCFSFAVATAKDLQTIMICRFFAGFIGAAPLVVAPAVMADLFSAKIRGTAISIFAMILFGGPMLAPIIGGFTVKNPNLGWRWTSYLCAIIGCGALAMNTFILEETHHPIILVRKAELLRRRTGNWGIYAPHEELTLSLKEIVEKNIARPLKLLFTEPIIFLVSIYNAFIYGMLYMFLTAIPLIFSVNYGFSPGVAELPYLSMLIGVFSGGFIIIFFERRYNIAMDKNGGRPLAEERLPPMMIGSLTFVLGIFWLGWSGSYPQQVHWIVPTIGIAFVGNGLILIFLPCMNYIIDCYLYLAASALAGNTFLRSSFGAAFPLFSMQMFVNMKIQWASTLVGCIGIAMIPVPFLFYKYGKKIREKSKYAM